MPWPVRREEDVEAIPPAGTGLAIAALSTAIVAVVLAAAGLSVAIVALVQARKARAELRAASSRDKAS